jgi:deoxyribonuclease IV
MPSHSSRRPREPHLAIHCRTLNYAGILVQNEICTHHSLGQGEIGWEVFRFIMTDKRFENVPLVLETIDETLWPEEIAQLRRLQD